MSTIELSARQRTILEWVKENGPLSSKELADRLQVSRAALRADLAVLTMSGLLEARPRVGYYYSGKDEKDIIAGMLSPLRVKDAHSISVAVREKTSVSDVIVKMFIEDVGTMFIVSQEGFLEGVVSRKDLLKTALGQRKLEDLPISVIMTRMPNIIVTTPEESVLRAAQKLLTHQVDSLPVVILENTPDGERYRLLGRFTKSNITRLFVQMGSRS